MLHWVPEHRKSPGIEPPRVRNPSGPRDKLESGFVPSEKGVSGYSESADI